MEVGNDIREKIVRLAQQKMGEVGIRSVSIDDICRELGMSKKTFYVYFSTKDDLISAILLYHYDEVKDCMEAFFRKYETTWDILRVSTEKMATLPDVRQLPPFIYDLNKYYPALAKAYNARILTLNEDMMKRMVVRGKQEGLFRASLNEDMAAQMLARWHNNVVMSGLDNESAGLTLHRLADFTMDVLIRGMLSADGLQKYEELLSKVKINTNQ